MSRALARLGALFPAPPPDDNPSDNPSVAPAQPRRAPVKTQRSTPRLSGPSQSAPEASKLAPPHSTNSFWLPKASARAAALFPAPAIAPLKPSKLPVPLQKAAAEFEDAADRLARGQQLVQRYPAVHTSKYAPITSNSRHIPARDRILWASPPDGCPRRTSPSLEENEVLNYRAALVRIAAGGATGWKQVGYALKCFFIWALTWNIPDGRLMPLQPDVLEAYIASLAGYVSKKCILSRIAALRKWHAFYDVAWIVGEADLDIPLAGAARLAPYSKLKREPLLVDSLVAIFPHLDLSNSFDLAWWAATTFAHRACLRSGEFTIPSAAAFSPDRHISLGNIRIVHVDGGSKGIRAHLPHDKVNGARGADVSVTALERGHVACPVAALAMHLEKNNIVEKEPLFSYRSSRGKSRGSKIGMTKAAWRSRLDELLVAAGLPSMSGHSVRIGGATQLLLDGVDPLVVKVVGRWTSDAFEVYWRNGTAIMAHHAASKASASAPRYAEPANMLEELRALAGLVVEE